VGGLVLFFTGLAAAGQSVITRALVASDRVILTDLDIRTNGTLNDARVLKETGLATGDNLLDIDIEAVKEDLVAMPQVASAEVVRTLPDRLSIAIEERTPLAWLSCPPAGVLSMTSNGGYLLDTDGFVFRCDALLQEYLHLPVIHVREPSRIQDGVKIGPGPLQTAVEILHQNEDRLPGGEWDVREIEVLSGYSVDVRYRNDAVVTFGTSDLSRQFDDLVVIVGHAGDIGKHVQTLNLMVKRNIPVTYFDFGGRDLEMLRRSRTSPGRQDGEGDPARRRARGILGAG
jgi:hypothetical protein